MFDILRVNGSECGEGLSCEALLPPLSQYVKFNSTVISGRVARVVTAPLLVVTQNRTIRYSNFMPCLHSPYLNGMPYTCVHTITKRRVQHLPKICDPFRPIAGRWRGFYRP